MSDSEDNAPTCADCGDPIHGQIVRVPVAGAGRGKVEYHRGCTEIEYPEHEDWRGPTAHDFVENYMDMGKSEELEDFFKTLADKPDASPDEIGEVLMTFVEEFDTREEVSFLDWLLNRELYVKLGNDVKGPLMQAVLFGCAWEREYPAFSEDDPQWDEDEGEVTY